MREEQISLLTEKKQELLSNEMVSVQKETQPLEPKAPYVKLDESHRNHRMRMLRKARRR